MDEIGGKCLAPWKITAPLDGAGILDETSRPITMAILHHFCTQQIAVTTFKRSPLMIKKRGLIKKAEGFDCENAKEEDFFFSFFPVFHHKITFPVHFNIAVITFV